MDARAGERESACFENEISTIDNIFHQLEYEHYNLFEPSPRVFELSRGYTDVKTMDDINYSSTRNDSLERNVVSEDIVIVCDVPGPKPNRGSAISSNQSSLSRVVSKEMKISDSVVLTPSFIHGVFNLINCCEFDSLNDLVERCSKQGYVLNLCKPNKIEPFIGNGIFAKLWKSIFDTCPDLVMSIPTVKYHGRGTNYRIIEASFSYQCTYPLGEGMHCREFRDDNFRKTYDFVSDVVDKNTPDSRIKKYRNIVAEAKSTNQLISVSARGILRFTLDEFSNRLGKINVSIAVTDIAPYHSNLFD